MRTVLVGVVATVAASLGAAGCGAGSAGTSDGPRVVVTTTILGDVVRELVGTAAEVEVLMPPNADPHDFSPSARQAASLRDADVVVMNGLGFEVGLLDTISSAEDDGAVVLAATDHVETVPFAAQHDGEDHEDEDHAEDEHVLDEDHGAHDHEGDDPHVFTDPVRMASIARGLAGDLAREVPELGTEAAQDRTDRYVAELEALHEEVTTILDAVPAGRRTLVTNHEVLGYFADRYGFDLVGVVVPGGSTLAEPSAAALAQLLEAMEETGTPAIFVEASSPHRIADAVAAERPGTEVVELFTESLGAAGSGADTYLGMVETNARRIADALAEP